MVSTAVNTARARVRDRIAEHRLGGHGGTTFNFAGDCALPVEMFTRGLPDEILVHLKLESDSALVSTLHVRCRKCEPCLTHRARIWAARAAEELKVSERSWFGTLTLSPIRLMQEQMLAEAKLLHGGWPIAEITSENLFQEIVKAVRPELQKFLKRIRKNSGAKVRYLIIAEPHDGDETTPERRGMPHWHLFVHETRGSVTKRILESGWRYGFSHWRLVSQDDHLVPWYVCKYLTKCSTYSRILNSEQYGNGTFTLAERLNAALGLLKQSHQ